MLKHKIKKSTLVVTAKISSLVQYLLRDEASSGKFLLIAAAIALICTNSPLSAGYEHVWLQHITVSISSLNFFETLRDVINEGLMAIFFLVVGLEVKREMVHGELRKFRAAILPIAAAIGGMLVPALLYIAINAGHGGFSGWGVPMATDIAFAVGVLALISKRIPASLKLFLLTLAVVDDIGAVIVIAVFYTAQLHIVSLLLAAAILAGILALQWLRLLNLPTFIVLGILLWLTIYSSGIHASITGVLLGLAAPIVARTRTSARRALAERLEKALIPISTFFVIPLFALANAGVIFSASAFKEHDALLVGVGIISGLVMGKVIGILGASWLMVRLNLARLPEGVEWRHITGVGVLAGIGFTLSLFIAELSFNATFLSAAKISIFIASILSAAIGLSFLVYADRSTQKHY